MAEVLKYINPFDAASTNVFPSCEEPRDNEEYCCGQQVGKTGTASESHVLSSPFRRTKVPAERKAVHNPHAGQGLWTVTEV
ncbi:hypothetical protein Fuma_06148 [Fuerstiella marisgermanici]|uniref:Uncharacterized protein n=1 Tax=Fuerstiella marisgermanici TaxID=1891926 RepID=A0A1P8WR13_9PLAN|nr:hypothetical protein Fuma_06148 [Fuerstiella marisgermanici]